MPRQVAPVVEDLQVGALSWAAVQTLPKAAGIQGSTLHGGNLWSWSRSGLQRWDLTVGRHDLEGPIQLHENLYIRSYFRTWSVPAINRLSLPLLVVSAQGGNRARRSASYQRFHNNPRKCDPCDKPSCIRSATGLPCAGRALAPYLESSLDLCNAWPAMDASCTLG